MLVAAVSNSANGIIVPKPPYYAQSGNISVKRAVQKRAFVAQSCKSGGVRRWRDMSPSRVSSKAGGDTAEVTLELLRECEGAHPGNEKQAKTVRTNSADAPAERSGYNAASDKEGHSVEHNI